MVPRSVLLRILPMVGMIALLAPYSALATVPNPCLSLPKTQVAQALGGTVTGTMVIGNSEARSCTWAGPLYHATEGPEHPVLHLAVFNDSKSEFQRFSKSSGYVQVSGVGASAYYNPGGAGSLRVWQDGVTITLNASVVNTSATLKSLAASALHRL